MNWKEIAAEDPIVYLLIRFEREDNCIEKRGGPWLWLSEVVIKLIKSAFEDYRYFCIIPLRFNYGRDFGGDHHYRTRSEIGLSDFNSSQRLRLNAFDKRDSWLLSHSLCLFVHRLYLGLNSQTATVPHNLPDGDDDDDVIGCL